MVTVLMSVYNGREYLVPAIKSILGQTFDDFEFVIIDDASNDGSKSLIHSFEDKRISLFKNESNIGLAKSLNFGIQKAKGKYILRMDADDISHPERIHQQVMYMEANPEVGVCGTWVRAIGETTVRVWEYPTDDPSLKSRLVFEAPFAHPSVIMRRNVLFENNMFYDEQLRASQDYDLWIRLAPVTKFANLPSALLDYRVHGGSVTSKSKEQGYNANILRKGMLRRLNLSATPVEAEIHNRISSWDFDFTFEEMIKVERWLWSLKEANDQVGLFPEPQFFEILADRWFEACYSRSSGGIRAWRLFHKSSLADGINFGERKAKFLIKSLAHLR